MNVLFGHRDLHLMVAFSFLALPQESVSNIQRNTGIADTWIIECIGIMDSFPPLEGKDKQTNAMH